MENSQPEDLVILHFNDAYNIQPDKAGNLGFVNFYDYVLSLKQKFKNPLLVFSGDAFAPSKLSRIFQGEQMVYCLKRLNIDIACYGNHDFDFQPKQCLKLAKQCNFPWLMGNVKYLDTDKNIGDGLDYHIITHCGVKIGFMGLGGPDFIGRLISDYKNKLKYHQIIDYAKKMCAFLIEQKCQLIIALTHCRRPIDENLAEKVPQIDLILGGHDHSRILKLVNKIPIVKSGSDFQFLSIIKPSHDKAEQKQQSNKDMFVGRNWSFHIRCHTVKKSTNHYPELENYIKQAVQAREGYDNNKSIAGKHKIKPQMQERNQWLLNYHSINNRHALSLTAGLSAQICFAKYVAFKKDLIYVGYKRGSPEISDNFVQETLDFIYLEVKTHANLGKTVLYSPGICSVPYLVETGNLIYLPSHFLVGVNSIKSLSNMLKVANEKGYRCYAVMGYDPFIPDKLCAWIKFTHPPLQYLKLVEELEIDDIILMSVHDHKGQQHGSQQTARLIGGKDLQKDRQTPQSEDIYLLFVKQSYGKSPQKDLIIFKKLIRDISEVQWKQISERPLCKCIHDWQSGIDCIQYLQARWKTGFFQKNENFHYILNRDSFPLYLCAYHLGREFIAFNAKQNHPTGVVFNQYFMNNPTYELNFGWIPVLYWQFYPHNQERLTKVLTEKELKLKRWCNTHKGTNFSMIQPDSKVIATTHEGVELGQWISKYAPKEYKLKYLDIKQMLTVLAKNKLLFKAQINQNIEKAKFVREL